jgi:RNA polymerase sigma-70 factor (ECF subfamily)
MTANDTTGDTGLGVASPVVLEDLRRQMLRFATLQLGDPQLAEDAVQDALVGALRNAQSFRGASALRTWVFAILKNKIADVLRQRQRLVYAGSLLASTDEDDGEPPVFDQQGHWHMDERPVDWGDPQAALDQADFWRVLTACLDGLPARQARVLMMREMIGLESEAICATVGITRSNLHVTLHRARLRLRECLENHWFAGKDLTC